MKRRSNGALGLGHRRDFRSEEEEGRTDGGVPPVSEIERGEEYRFGFPSWAGSVGLGPGSVQVGWPLPFFLFFVLLLFLFSDFLFLHTLFKFDSN
jgi:hypothetical protein